LLESFHKLCDVAKVPRIRVHDTRHSCGTLLHVQGADPFVIQEVLGHSQLTTTRRYTHVPIGVTKTAVVSLEAAFEMERKRQKDKQELEATDQVAPTTIQPQSTLVQ